MISSLLSLFQLCLFVKVKVMMIDWHASLRLAMKQDHRQGSVKQQRERILDLDMRVRDTRKTVSHFGIVSKLWSSLLLFTVDQKVQEISPVRRKSRNAPFLLLRGCFFVRERTKFLLSLRVTSQRARLDKKEPRREEIEKIEARLALSSCPTTSSKKIAPCL